MRSRLGIAVFRSCDFVKLLQICCGRGYLEGLDVAEFPIIEVIVARLFGYQAWFIRPAMGIHTVSKHQRFVK
jgi:hypothetical protein